ncbi:glycosyltransferase [Desulfovibrio sp. OttesenSCG-928-C06]|nr:glycosyltransferase [Desulfovibrio sp. OttesenSCG-928-C06]
MLSPTRTAVLFTTNTPQIAQAELLIGSLRNPALGNFQGDVWAMSTHLTSMAKNSLEAKGINFLVNPLERMLQWNAWKGVAKAQKKYQNTPHDVHKDNNRFLEECFWEFKNRLMSKLILIDWVEKFGARYDYIALCDTDIYIQNDFNLLLKAAYDKNPDKISYWHEENEIAPGTWLWEKNRHFFRLQGASNLDLGMHEINVGFLSGRPSTLRHIFKMVDSLFFSLSPELFTDHHWHEQDCTRVVRAMHPELFSMFDEGKVIHVCNGGHTAIKEEESGKFLHKKTLKAPTVVHFAGGTWRHYPTIAPYFKVPYEDYFQAQIDSTEYDVIRNRARLYLFENNSKYYTALNARSKCNARKRWIRTDHSKKKVLLIGWLNSHSHKSQFPALEPFLTDPRFNTCVINANLLGDDLSEYIVEDMPDVLAYATNSIKDPFIATQFGSVNTDIPEEFIEESIKTLMLEYHCNARAARAIMNLAFTYISDVMDFYQPDLILMRGAYGFLGRMLKKLCPAKRVLFASQEDAVLPGTMTFDFMGHMGASWVNKEHNFFNNLPLDDSDREVADKYLAIAPSQEYSRNMPTNIPPHIWQRINLLHRQNKKLLLYMGSNAPSSGYTPYEKYGREHSPVFSCDAEAYTHLQELCARHPDWHILYKPHPITQARGLDVELNYDNTTLIRIGDLSKCLELADCAITLVSQSSYVALLNNTPVVQLGINQLTNSGAVYNVDTSADFEQTLETSLQHGISERQKKSFLEHVARLLKYYVFSGHPELPHQRNVSDMANAIESILDGKPEQHYIPEYNATKSQMSAWHKPVKSAAPVVSVILAVHNGEDYLHTCLASILEQSLRDIEIIAVNNDSTDNSAAILEKFASKDPRLKIITYNKAHLGIARNLGMDEAQGKYIHFMDCDDTLSVDAYQRLVSAADEHKSDLIYYFYRCVHHAPNGYHRPRFLSYLKFFPQKSIFQLEQKYFKYMLHYMFPWAKLIRRESFTASELYYDEKWSFFEDSAQGLKLLLAAKNPIVYQDYFYNYRIRTTSNAMTKKVHARSLAAIDTIQSMNNDLLSKNMYCDLQKSFVQYKINMILVANKITPSNHKQHFFDSLKDILLPSDEMFIYNDELYSTYEMFYEHETTRIKRAVIREL